MYQSNRSFNIPPGHSQGIWRLFLPGREGIWSPLTGVGNLITSLDVILRVALTPCGLIYHGGDKLWWIQRKRLIQYNINNNLQNCRVIQNRSQLLWLPYLQHCDQVYFWIFKYTLRRCICRCINIMEWMYGMYLTAVAWNNIKPTMNSVCKHDLGRYSWSNSDFIDDVSLDVFIWNMPRILCQGRVLSIINHA